MKGENIEQCQLFDNINHIYFIYKGEKYLCSNAQHQYFGDLLESLGIYSMDPYIDDVNMKYMDIAMLPSKIIVELKTAKMHETTTPDFCVKDNTTPDCVNYPRNE